MKKKFLSLMMAAAVVATTSVSAFAAVEDADNSVNMPTQSNINTLDSSDRTHEVNITGKVQSDTGEMPATTFKVTVPTAANFTVNQAGNVVGPTLTVKNEGPQAIKVLAQGFENTGKGTIKVLSAEEISSGSSTLNRSNISLKLVGENGQVAYLAAGNGKSGVSNDAALGTTNDEVELANLTAGEGGATQATIALKGTAGQKTGVTTALSDTFKLTLKIKKAQ